MNPLFQDLLYKPKFTKNQMGLKSGFKASDRTEDQGADRRKSTAYTVVCEHFEEVRNTDVRC